MRFFLYPNCHINYKQLEKRLHLRRFSKLPTYYMTCYHLDLAAVSIPEISVYIGYLELKLNFILSPLCLTIFEKILNLCKNILRILYFVIISSILFLHQFHYPYFTAFHSCCCLIINDSYLSNNVQAQLSALSICQTSLNFMTFAYRLTC